jgi:hypothetical protein
MTCAVVVLCGVGQANSSILGTSSNESLWSVDATTTGHLIKVLVAY